MDKQNGIAEAAQHMYGKISRKALFWTWPFLLLIQVLIVQFKKFGMALQCNITPCFFGLMFLVMVIVWFWTIKMLVLLEIGRVPGN